MQRASVLLVFAFGGFENANVLAEEATDPKRHLPIALILAIGLTTVLYVLIQMVALGTLPDLAHDCTPLASAAACFLGPAGAAVMTVGAVLSTLGSESALVLVGPRILYAFAQAGQLPAALGRIHPRYRTPHVAVLAFSGAPWAAALRATFAELAPGSATARLLFYAANVLAIPVLRRKLP